MKLLPKRPANEQEVKVCQKNVASFKNLRTREINQICCCQTFPDDVEVVAVVIHDQAHAIQNHNSTSDALARFSFSRPNPDENKPHNFQLESESNEPSPNLTRGLSDRFNSLKTSKSSGHSTTAKNIEDDKKSFFRSSFRSSFKGTNKGQIVSSSLEVPKNMRIIEKHIRLPGRAKPKHIYSGPGKLTAQKAREISARRNFDITTNTVFQAPNHWNLCQYTNHVNNSERRIVSSAKVATFQCRRRGHAWQTFNKGQCFAIFREDSHLMHMESFATA